MKITISSHALLESVTRVSKACAENASVPILAGVKMTANDGHVTFVATNGTESIRRVNVANVEEEGETVVSGKTLLQIAKGLPDAAATIETDGSMVKLTCMKSKYRLNTLNPADFPEFPVVERSQAIELQASLVMRLVDKVKRSVSTDMSRPIICGVHVTANDGVLRLEATDSYRFSMADAGADGEFEAVIPAKALSDAIDLANDTVTISRSDNQACITSGSTTYVTRLLDGSFPDLSSLLPKSYNTLLEFEPMDFAESLKRVEVTAKDNPSVRVSMSESEMFVQLQTSSPSEGESTDVFAGSVEGADILMAFNVRYLKDVIAGCDGPATMEFVGPMQPAIIKCYGDVNYLALLMPVRL